MKNYYAIFAACAAAVLSSCGTQIQMTEAIPAKVCLGRGTTVYIGSPYKDYGLERALTNKILSDGYYTLPGYSNASNSSVAHLSIRNIETGIYAGMHYLAADAHVYRHGSMVYNKGYVGTASQDPQSGKIYYDNASKSIANSVMNDLTPHEKNFYVRVKGNSKNPDIERGALACRAGNWAQGEVYARQAININPQDAEAYFLLGVIERNKMNYNKSTQYFQKAYALKPHGKYQTAISKNRVMQQNDQYVQQQL